MSSSVSQYLKKINKNTFNQTHWCINKIIYSHHIADLIQGSKNQVVNREGFANTILVYKAKKTFLKGCSILPQLMNNLSLKDSGNSNILTANIPPLRKSSVLIPACMSHNTPVLKGIKTKDTTSSCLLSSLKGNHYIAFLH